MSLFFSLLRILAEENLEEMDEEEILELLEDEDLEEIERLINQETEMLNKVLH